MGAIIRTRSRTQSGVCQSSFAEDISGASRSTLDGTCRTAAGRGPPPPAARALPRDPPAIVARSPERLADHSPAVLGLELSEPLPGLVLFILPSVVRRHARLVGRGQFRMVL